MGKKAAYFFAILFIILVALAIYLINPFANKIKSGLQVVTNDVSATLFLDDQYLDKTPYINKKIQPGTYRLQIVPDDSRLAAYETQVTLNKGLLTVVIWKPGQTAETSGGVVYELEPLPSKNQTEVSFVSQPDNAIVQFDEQAQQFTPVVIKDVEPGHHSFEASLPSWEIQQHTISAVAGHRLNVRIKLGKTEAPLPDSPAQTQTDQEATDSAEATQETNPDLEENNQINSNNSSRESILNGEDANENGFIKIQSTNYFQEGIEVLRVRDAATVSGESVGFVESEKSYPYLGETDNDWYKISFQDALDNQQKTGWVSGQYSQLIENNDSLLNNI